MNAKRKIIWTKLAALQFNAAINHIRQDLEQNADKIKEKVLLKITELSDSRMVHRKDPFKINNDGKYLFFEVTKYRIVYYAEATQVFIIRFRHTSMEPKKY